MLTKGLVLGLLLASTPIYLVATPRATADDGAPTPTAAGRAAAADAGELDELRARAETAERRATGAEARAADLGRQLEEALDLLQACASRRHDCTPSRSLLTQYQWLHRNGHDERAASALERIVERTDDRADRLNSMAWNLMTDEDTAGRFDRAALALAQRLEAKGDDLRHRYLDTIALAKFLNGDLEGAVRAQTRAIERGGKSDDYRRRLRTYQAALRALEDARPRALLHDEE